jgi:hypothetical protein
LSWIAGDKAHPQRQIRIRERPADALKIALIAIVIVGIVLDLAIVLIADH